MLVWPAWSVFQHLVPVEGLEPPLLSEADFESAASTIPPQGQELIGDTSNAAGLAPSTRKAL